MKLLYCHVDFLSKKGKKLDGGFRGLDRIDLNLSTMYTFAYNSEKHTISAVVRDKPLPYNFWASGEERSNIYNINVIAGKNGAGKSTVINYLIDLLYYIYLDYGRQTTNIPNSARFDVQSNYNLLVLEENRLLYVVELIPESKTIQPVKGLLSEATGAHLFENIPQRTYIVRGVEDKSPRARAFLKQFKRLKIIYMMNNPTQRDYERNLDRQEGGLRDYFVYDCSIGANLGEEISSFFPYEVYKQVRYLFDSNQIKIRGEVKKRIKIDQKEPDEFVMPKALRIRPRQKMLDDGLIQHLLPSLQAIKKQDGKEKSANDLKLNELLGVLCCRSFAENVSKALSMDIKGIVDSAVSHGFNTPFYNNYTMFNEQIRCIHEIANDVLVNQHIKRNATNNAYTCIAVLPNGNIAVGSRDSTIYEWNESTSKWLLERKGHSDWISCIVAIHDGRIVSASRDNSIRVWNEANSEISKPFLGHTKPVTSLAVLSDSRIVSGSRDNTIRIWNTNTGECIKTLTGHTNWVNCLAALPDGRLVSGSDDGTIRIWNTDTWDCLQKLTGHTNWINCLAALPDGRVVSGSDDNTIRIWNTDTGNCIKTLSKHTARINCLAVFPDGRFVSGSEDTTLRIWSTAGDCIAELNGHTQSVNGVDVFPDGCLVSSSYDGTIRKWDNKSYNCISILYPDPVLQFINSLRHNCVNYLSYLANNKELFGQFLKVSNEVCSYELPLTSESSGTEQNKNVLPLITEFLQKYQNTTKPVYTIDFDWGLSSGEENMLRLFSNLFHIFDWKYSGRNYKYYKITNNEYRRIEQGSTCNCNSVLLLMDEADLTLHPEWQRRLVYVLTSFLPHIYPKSCAKDIQMVLSTHSPLLLGDIPRENIYYLGNNPYPNDSANGELTETFGQNIHTILKDSFFLNSGTVGEFAATRINRIAARLEEIIEKETTNPKKHISSMKPTYRSPSPQELIDIRKTIDLVASGILRAWLEGKWREVDVILNAPISSSEIAIELAEKGKKLTQEERQYILREWIKEGDI